MDTTEGATDPRQQGLLRARAVLEDWTARRQATPCWRVAAHLMNEIETAASSLRHSISVVKSYQEQDDADLQARALRTLRRWWGAILGVALTLTLWWWLSPRFANAGQPGVRAVARFGMSLGWRVLVVTILGALMAWFISFLRYQKEMFRLVYRHNRRVHEFDTAIRNAEHDSRQVVRLTAQYDQAREWGEVVAWMLRRPEGPPHREVTGETRPANVATPLALTRAAGQATTESLQRVAAQVANDRFQRGWLGQLYVTYAESAMSQLAHRRGLDTGSVRFDPDTDLVDSLRPEVAAAIRTGAPSEIWTSEITRDVRTHLARTDPKDLFPEVVLLDRSQPRHVVPARDFLDDIVPSDDAVRGVLPLLATFWSRTAVFGQRHRTTAVHVWMPDSMQGVVDGGALARHPVVISSRDDDSFMLQAVRVDVAGPVSWEDVATTLEPVRNADDDLEWGVPAPIGGAL